MRLDSTQPTDGSAVRAFKAKVRSDILKAARQAKLVEHSDPKLAAKINEAIKVQRRLYYHLFE